MRARPHPRMRDHRPDRKTPIAGSRSRSFARRRSSGADARLGRVDGACNASRFGAKSCHPERLNTFAVHVAARDADVAQGLVAEELQFTSRPRALPPLGELALHLVPTHSTIHSTIGEGHAHGWLHNLASPNDGYYPLGSRRGM